MSKEVCSKCERRIGEEVLRCPLLQARECPFVTKTISNQDSRRLAWSLIIIGLVVLYFTLPLAQPEDYVSSVFVIIEIFTISLLFLISLLTISVGYIILRTKKLIAYDPANKNIWEKQIVGGIELHSIIISDWKEYNFLIKFKPVTTQISEHLRYPQSNDEKLNQVIFLSNILLNLIIQGYLKAYTANEYQVSGQAIDDISDNQKIYLATSKSLATGAGDLENKIYQTVCDLQVQQGAHFAVPLQDLIELLPNIDYLNQQREEHSENNDSLVENIYLLDAEKRIFNSKYLEQEIYACLSKKQATIWKNFESLFTHKYFRNARVFVFTMALLSFIVLRFYLPLYRVEKFTDKIDNQQVVDFVKKSSAQMVDLTRYLKDRSSGIVDFNRVQQDLNSNVEELKLQALDALAQLKITENTQAYQSQIKRLLNDKSEQVQRKTLRILEDWTGSLHFAAPDLLNLLGSPDPKISYQAAEILGNSDIDPTIALPALRGYIGHQDILTRLAVEAAIKNLSK